MNAQGRVPGGWSEFRAARPDRERLVDAGFDVVGSYTFPIEHRWTRQALGGLVLSTSFLPYGLLGERADEFEQDLGRELAASDPTGQFSQTIAFTYQLAQRR